MGKDLEKNIILWKVNCCYLWCDRIAFNGIYQEAFRFAIVWLRSLCSIFLRLFRSLKILINLCEVSWKEDQYFWLRFFYSHPWIINVVSQIRLLWISFLQKSFQCCPIKKNWNHLHPPQTINNNEKGIKNSNDYPAAFIITRII